MTLVDPVLRAGLAIAALTVRIPLPRRRVVHAATDVTLDVPRGRVTALVGESGCGKSVVAGAVLGLLPPHAEIGGVIRVPAGDRQLDVRTTDEPYRGRHVGLVPQSPATHFTPVRTVGAQLLETLDRLGSPHGCADLAERVGFPIEALDRYPHELSGGMAQRAAVAAALAGDPETIVADEPTSGLDRDRTDHVLRLLRECADHGAAVLLITHDLAALIRTGIADTLAVMYASHLMETGPAAELLDDPWHEYTRDLLAALPARGLRPLPHPSPELTDLTVERCHYLGGPTTLTARGPRLLRERSR
ncbi:ATP-binding cassette domain-containing protein [Nocardia otitidiscaviarum]|uniref:ATP-binding cassette domain-containing protein n=1 Tax=Nocardia otitidiscaviarum TaxID=1823 RepID=UPI00163DAA77|nr:ATP-binding cassette domain-containing protein [Nocardia otitidiscaviarum]MCP9620240.1 ATP-binding cassette domain-containing protein [Nocardia otitidiscaviarum]